MRRTMITVLVLTFMVFCTTQAQAAFTEGFESWTNAETVKDWSKTIHGDIWGGEFNQIYYAGQGISCGGNGSNYKSVHRDIKVTAGETYNATVEAMSNSTNTAGVKDGSYVKMWIQYDDKDGKVLATHGVTGANLSDRLFKEMKVEGTAPAGTDHARITLQVMGGTGGGTVFTNFNFYHKESATVDTKVAGPDFIRNTEWLNKSNVQQLWTAYSEGGGPGDYVMRPTSGSSQGISVGGKADSYREIYRTFSINDYKVADASKNIASVMTTSNALNQNSVKDASLVEMHMQFSDDDGKLITGGSSASGADFSVGSQDAVKMTVQAATPTGATKITIMLRVKGGKGGGAVFDDFSLTTAP